ncbi:MAG: DUF4126 domain-containing protein [Desulfotalea sp.]
MDSYQEIIKTISLTMGVSWASGINLYAAIALLGFFGASGNVDLPVGLEVLENPLVIGAATIMYCVEFFADKTPGVDTAWDAVHSFIRIPAGVMLAAGAVGDVSPELVIAAGVLGGAVSTVSHGLKAGSRAILNTSPEPFSNWTASITEDLLVIGGIWTALTHPLIFLILFLFFIVIAIYLIPKIFTALKVIFKRIQAFITGNKNKPAPIKFSAVKDNHDRKVGKDINPKIEI